MKPKMKAHANLQWVGEISHAVAILRAAKKGLFIEHCVILILVTHVELAEVLTYGAK